MAQTNNIYDLTERAAVRRAIPRLELWQAVAKALIDGTLPAPKLSTLINAGVSRQITYRSWLFGFRAAVDRYNDPNACAHILKHIIVSVSAFEKWLSRAQRGRRGPVRGTTGLFDSDRQFFRDMYKLIRDGKAQSAYGAALQLANRIGGYGKPESKAKRLSARYRKENPEMD